MRNDYVVFILSHGRANNLKTLDTLRKCGYTGEWYVVIDDEDETENEYRRLYADRVLQFQKKEIAKTFDTMDLSEERRTIVYARNACFNLAEDLGYRYFIELDDDYINFEYRFKRKGKDKLFRKRIENLDKCFSYMFDFLDETGALTVAMAQGGDFIGGKDSGNYNKQILRKAMNSFFCDTHKRFQFVGRINEDVNTYVSLGTRGEKIFTVCNWSLIQTATQSNKGGMTDAYLDSGTYLKSFYSVIVAPSCVKLVPMGDKHYRIHHSVAWNNCAPKIINEKWKK